MLERLCVEAEELIAEEMMLTYDSLPQEMKDEIFLEREYKATKGTLSDYDEYDELERLRAEAQEIFAEERMTADEERAKVDIETLKISDGITGRRRSCSRGGGSPK